MTIKKVLKEYVSWRVCVMILVEIAVFGVVYYLFSQLKPHVDTDEIEYKIAEFDRELTAEIAEANFGVLDMIAGIAFLVVIWFVWRIYHDEYAILKICEKSIVWLVVTGVVIYFCAKSLGADGIRSFIPLGAGWDTTVRCLSPRAVVWCGFGYALPIGIAALLCRFIYEKNVQEQTFYTDEGVMIPPVNGWPKKIVYIVLICVVMSFSIFVSLIMNLWVYLSML